MSDLFDYMEEVNKKESHPLAFRRCPKRLEDFIGQEHIVGEKKLLRRIIEADRLTSIILYGPPGTGKTSLAMVIANTTEAEFVTVNATISGKKDIQNVIKRSKELRAMYNKKTILFIDEIHRFNKAQQDLLLPYVEDATVILIGATTENPYFEVNKALVSRSTIFNLKPLTEENIKSLLTKAILEDMGLKNVKIEDKALEFIARLSNGDARRAYNALELAALSTKELEGEIYIDEETVADCMQEPRVNYDKNGDNHYDTISAFIKSMRGSDPDATVYYLAKMIYAGEDVKFIARRIMIAASEDVSNANPMALVVATNASLAVERIGLPEARIILAQAALYVALSPKSNSSYLAIDRALELVKSGDFEVPSHLCDAHYSGASTMKKGLGYKYAHSYPYHYVVQDYLPKELREEKIFTTDEIGEEKDLIEYLRKIRGMGDEKDT